MSSNRDRVRTEFTRQAANFERPGSLFRDRSILDWIAAHVPVAAGDRVLDVAGGTGQTGRHLAGEDAFAVIADLTAGDARHDELDGELMLGQDWMLVTG